jgi:hypothetical protein
VSPPRLAVQALQAEVGGRFRVQIPRVELPLGEVVTLSSDPQVARALSDHLAGRGQGSTLAGAASLSGAPLDKLAPETRVRRGLVIPEPRGISSASEFSELLDLVNATRKIQGRGPVSPLDALTRAGLEGFSARPQARAGDAARSELVQARLVESPLAIVVAPEGMPPTVREYLALLAAETLDEGRGLLVIGDVDALDAELGRYRTAGAVLAEVLPPEAGRVAHAG